MNALGHRRRAQLIGLLISLVALGLVLRSVDLGSSLAVLTRANPLPLLACLLFITAQVTLRSWRWQILLDSGKSAAHVPLVRVVPPLLAGYLANAVLPARLGEAVRAAALAWREHLSFSMVLGTALLERIVDTTTLALIVTAGAVLVRAPDWLVAIGVAVSVFGVLIMLVLATVGIEPLVQLARLVLGRVAGKARLERLIAALRHFANGLGIRDRRQATAYAAVLSGLCWGLEAINFYLISVALGIDLSPGGALLVAGFTVLATAIPAAPGYLGTFELAAASVAGALGVAPAPALAFALAAHITTFLPVLMAGTLSALVLGLEPGRMAQKAQAAAELEGTIPQVASAPFPPESPDGS